MYNVTLRRLRVNIFAVESNKNYIFWVCVCSLSYCACKTHAPYCRLWPVRLYNTFPRYHITGAIRKKKIAKIKIFVLIFSTNFSEILVILRRNERHVIKNLYWSSSKVPITLVRFWRKLKFLHRFSKNIQISNFMNIRPMEIVPCGRTDMMKPTVAFRNCAKAPKNWNYFRQKLRAE
jgi:hypothetical protein